LQYKGQTFFNAKKRRKKKMPVIDITATGQNIKKMMKDNNMTVNLSI